MNKLNTNEVQGREQYNMNTINEPENKRTEDFNETTACSLARTTKLSNIKLD